MGRPIQIQLPKNEIIDLFCNHKKSCPEIAKQFDVNPEVIRMRLKKYGIDTSANKNSDVKKGPRFKDLTGQIYGDTEVMSYSHKKTFLCKNNRKKTVYFWTCKCKCGKVLIKPSYALARNIFNGCRQCVSLKVYNLENGFKGVTTSYFSRIKKRAKKIKKGFDLTPEYLWNLYEKQNKKCIITGIPITLPDEICKSRTASLDRIDSSNGYIEGNVCWVHKVINRMKYTMSIEELVKWCKKIVNFNKDK